MCKVLLNIPHSGTNIPEWALDDILISEEDLELLLKFMTDKDVDKIWSFVPESSKQVADVSRLIVDTERYRNDADEEMASKGMGLYYTHTPGGREFRIKNEETYLRCLEIYDEYHSSLESKVSNCLENYSKCIILDCHSFHDDMDYTGYDSKSFPDVCVGTNGEITREARTVIEIFRAKGYSVKINEPFAGALVPLQFLNDERVVSIMIELNRRIYDNEDFGTVQGVCREIYEKLGRS